MPYIFFCDTEIFKIKCKYFVIMSYIFSMIQKFFKIKSFCGSSSGYFTVFEYIIKEKACWNPNKLHCIL